MTRSSVRSINLQTKGIAFDQPGSYQFALGSKIAPRSTRNLRVGRRIPQQELPGPNYLTRMRTVPSVPISDQAIAG